MMVNAEHTDTMQADSANTGSERAYEVYAWVILALVLILVPFRRGERWAWRTLWLLPVLWLCLFVLSPDLIGLLVLALVSVTGLLLSRRRFFPKSGQETLVQER